MACREEEVRTRPYITGRTGMKGSGSLDTQLEDEHSLVGKVRWRHRTGVGPNGPSTDPPLLSCESASLEPWRAGHKLPAVCSLQQLCLGGDSASSGLLESVLALREPTWL